MGLSLSCWAALRRAGEETPAGNHRDHWTWWLAVGVCLAPALVYARPRFDDSLEFYRCAGCGISAMVQSKRGYAPTRTNPMICPRCNGRQWTRRNV